ncbi:DNA-binding response regulator, OmpR family, contains REC and winged-helix (wHTH) domain [Clostridium cavendishii DSM 21758]|uniref:Stage 0 sporulation protein A homolog n=1 Tax=Clostridium cavendishii DSM 21758 TaxID=1121302 RepID=A0A1M6CJ83_9CLOT|nr:response regulator transcription factor [Clostridium cavendishii]SHI60921.1 DNA-binding response regulator, OmpR family, contains REC and winged-helix (wHTH) domain [Clostridium cavendishii DSM 21758]
MKDKILLIEDDYSISDALSFALRKEGFITRQCFNGQDGIDIFQTFAPDLVILDIMLPDMNGFDVCRKINYNNTPIIMLTARNDIVDKILGLELGADDYITKPFDIREVITRIKVALRRVSNYSTTIQKQEETPFIKLNSSIKLFKKQRKVIFNEEEVKLKPREFELLLFLSQNREIVFNRETLLDKVWGMDYDGDSRTVDIHIRRLRSKLMDDNTLIETIFGVGYKMRGYDEK